MSNQKEEIALTEKDIEKAEKLVNEVLARTGIKKKLLWEETRCRLIRVLGTAVNNFKAIPGVNVVATLVEKPIEAWTNRAEWRKDTKKNQWRLNITNEVRNILNEEYQNRSSEELKSTPAQYPKMHIDKVAEAVCGTVMARARNVSNKIALGVSGALIAVASVSQPAVLPIALGVTAICTYQQAKLNKRQIKINIAAKTEHDNKAKEVLREHTQVLENAQYYGNVANFSERMSQKMSEVSQNEVVANNNKQEVFRKNANENIDIMGFWGTVVVAAPMAVSFFDGGLSAVATTGLLGAASSSTCASLGIIAINNLVNSKLEATEAVKIAATHMVQLEAKDKTYTRGSKMLQKEDNTIVISKGMSYQHRNFNEKDAPLLGENLFEAGEDIVIGKGVTVLGGASGAGKSTLTALLRKASLATEGSIKLGHLNDDGEFVGTEYSEIANIVDNVGVAFQSAPVAESMSVGEYIMIENPDVDPEKVKEVKELLGIGSKGETGEIDENASVSNRLSGGQQKRIELARALIKDSPIMILDEPTSGVDEVMSNNIVEYLKELGKEKTIIYITHDAREIEAIGATQAIDIDKKHSEDGKNVIKTFDLSDEESRKNYIEFFENRRQVDAECKTEEIYRIATEEVVLQQIPQDRFVYNKEYAARVRGKLKNREGVDVKKDVSVQNEGVTAKNIQVVSDAVVEL